MLSAAAPPGEPGAPAIPPKNFSSAAPDFTAPYEVGFEKPCGSGVSGDPLPMGIPESRHNVVAIALATRPLGRTVGNVMCRLLFQIGRHLSLAQILMEVNDLFATKCRVSLGFSISALSWQPSNNALEGRPPAQVRPRRGLAVMASRHRCASGANKSIHAGVL